MSGNKSDKVFPQGKTAGVVSVSEGGLSLRDYFASQALTGIIDDCGLVCNNGVYEFEITAKRAYNMADAMIKEGLGERQ